MWYLSIRWPLFLIRTHVHQLMEHCRNRGLEKYLDDVWEERDREGGHSYAKALGVWPKLPGAQPALEPLGLKLRTFHKKDEPANVTKLPRKKN